MTGTTIKANFAEVILEDAKEIFSVKPRKNGKKNSQSSKRPRQIYPIVEIIWDDPTALTHGWLDNTDLADVKPGLVLSVGFLIQETEDHIIYASDLDPRGNHNGRTQLPRGVIKKLRVLKKADSQPL